MGRVPGGVKTYKPDSTTYKKRMKEVAEMLKSGRYSSVEMGKGGGYLAIEKSSAKHKAEEIEAGKILADKGYKIILKNEAGTHLTADGFIFKAVFEQSTPSVPQKGELPKGAKNIKKNLEHAKSKNTYGENGSKIDVAIIYDKHHLYNRDVIEQGIKEYEKHNNYRFKNIIVISHDGKIHKHRHHDI